jgi:hypothetical protein
VAIEDIKINLVAGQSVPSYGFQLGHRAIYLAASTFILQPKTVLTAVGFGMAMLYLSFPFPE